MSLTKMAFKLLTEKRALSGDEMLPHWALRNFGLLGDSIVSFIGQFSVPPERWIDIDSIMHNQDFPAGDMLHFVIEHFQSSLGETVLRQYVLVSILEEKLLHRVRYNDNQLTRLGDDLFDGENRLSLTAAGSTLVSTKIHLGVFIDSAPGYGFHGLREYNVDPSELAEVVIMQYRTEMRRISEKAWKMRPII